MSNHDHEALVAEFFEKCAKDSPERYREVCERYPVLTDSQMARRVRREIPISQFDDKGFRLLLHDWFYSSASHPELDYEESV